MKYNIADEEKVIRRAKNDATLKNNSELYYWVSVYENKQEPTELHRLMHDLALEELHRRAYMPVGMW